MILDLIQIYRARRDKALASKLALRFSQGQILDRATAPLLLVHLCLWGVTFIMFVIVMLITLTALKTHWAVGIIGLAPFMIGVSCGWVSVRLKNSLDQIRSIAANYTDSQIDKFLSQHHADPAPGLHVCTNETAERLSAENLSSKQT